MSEAKRKAERGGWVRFRSALAVIVIRIAQRTIRSLPPHFIRRVLPIAAVWLCHSVQSQLGGVQFTRVVVATC